MSHCLYNQSKMEKYLMNNSNDNYKKPRRVRTKNRFAAIGIAFFLVIGGLFYFVTIESEIVNAATTTYVDDDNTLGPWDGTLINPYQTIQDGVNNAIDGDTVFVFNGNYTENVIVNKTINLIGEDKNNTIIDGGGIYYKDVVQITSDWVNISGFIFTHSGNPKEDAGIQIDSNNNTIYGNIIYQCASGIFVNQSNDNMIFENNIFSNLGCGIFLSDSNSNDILRNTLVLNDQDGIWLRYSNLIIGSVSIEGLVRSI